MKLYKMRCACGEPDCAYSYRLPLNLWRIQIQRELKLLHSIGSRAPKLRAELERRLKEVEMLEFLEEP